MTVKLIRITVPPRHTLDWLDLCGGDSVNVEDKPDTQAIIVKQGKTQMVLDVGPEALDDLISRADYYVVEEFDHPSDRGIQASAKATLRRLEKDGHAYLQNIPGHSSSWRSTHRTEMSHEVPDPKPITVPVIHDMGKDWCPVCDEELVTSGGSWHHFMGERHGCPWTD